MKKVVPIVVLAGLLASPALGAPRSQDVRLKDQMAAMRGQVASLGAQVRTLQKQVQALQKQVKSVRDEAAANYAGDACLTALVADDLQGTWLVIDQIAGVAVSKTFFGPQTPLDDKKACSDLIPAIQRALPTPGVAPTIAPLAPFISWLYGP